MAPTAIQSDPPAIGAYWAGEGGWYAGRITYADSRVFDLVVADKAAEATLQWRTTRTGDVGAASTTDGFANTSIMTSDIYPGGRMCLGYSASGLDDWYMPASGELQVIYANLGPTTVGTPPLFATGGAQAFVADYYWSSTQLSTSGSRGVPVTMYNGVNSGAYKDTSYPVRPIRRVVFA